MVHGASNDRNVNTSDQTKRRAVLAGVASSGSLLLAGCAGGGSDGSDGSDGDGATSPTDTETTPATTTQASQKPIKIGLLTHLTGRFGFAGKNIKKSVELVVKEAESTGGILGRDVKIITFDTKVKPQRALRGFETLASKNVDVILGPSSASIPTLFEPAKERGLPIVTPTAGTTFLNTRGGKYIWRTTPSDTLIGRPQVLYALEQGWKKMAVTYLNNKGSRSFGKSVASFFKQQGGTVVKEMPLPPDATSYRSEIQKLAGADPDVIHVTMSEDTFPLFMQSYVEQGVEIPLMGGNEVTTSGMIDKVGADTLQGVVGVRNVPVKNYSLFKQKYKKMYGKKPGIFAPEAYDMTNTVALAWERAGSPGRMAIVNNLSSVGNQPGTKVGEYTSGKKALGSDKKIDYQGAATPCNFNENGNVFSPVAITRIQNGKWQNVKVYSASTLKEAGN